MENTVKLVGEITKVTHVNRPANKDEKGKEWPAVNKVSVEVIETGVCSIMDFLVPTFMEKAQAGDEIECLGRLKSVMLKNGIPHLEPVFKSFRLLRAGKAIA